VTLRAQEIPRSDKTLFRSSVLKARGIEGRTWFSCRSHERNSCLALPFGPLSFGPTIIDFNQERMYKPLACSTCMLPGTSPRQEVRHRSAFPQLLRLACPRKIDFGLAPDTASVEISYLRLFRCLSFGFSIMDSQEAATTNESKDQRFSPPAVSLPKGGGAIKGIGEKFAENPVSGTGSLSIPLPLSPGRSGFTPAYTLLRFW
jgi:hypothetical protein